MIAILAGIVFVAAGAYGIVHWWPSAVRWLRDFATVSLVFGGLIGILAGLSSFKKK